MSTVLDHNEPSACVAHDESALKSRPPSPSRLARRHAVTSSATMRVTEFADNEYSRVVAAVSLWCGSADDANDAVTDAVGIAWERLDRGQTIDNLAAWVTTVAMNAVRAGHRRRSRAKRKSHLVAVAPFTPGLADAGATRVDLQRALIHLGQRQREVVALHYGLDLTIAETASQLGIAEGTVKATLHRARHLLATELGLDDAEGGDQ